MIYINLYCTIIEKKKKNMNCNLDWATLGYKHKFFQNWLTGLGFVVLWQNKNLCFQNYC